MQLSLPDRSKTPLADELYRWLQQGLTALTAEQIAWVGGYMTALSAQGAGASAVAAPAGSPDITILVGSQTGNGDALANEIHRRAAARGLRSVIKKTGDYKLPQLKTEKNLLVIVSTHGEGEAPDNTKEMHEFLLGKRAPQLKQTHYAVLGLGDSSYEFFCKMGVDFDERLKDLGATRIHPRVDCDVDYDAAAEAWMEAVLTELAGRISTHAPVVTGSFTAPALTSTFSRRNPFSSVLLEDIVLNGRGSLKETHHIELSLEDSGLTYEPGDAVGIYPTNAPEVVDELLQALRFEGGETVRVEEKDIDLHTALTHHLECTIITRPAMQKYAGWAKQDRLSHLLGADGRDELNEYLYGREIVDLVTDFPAEDLSPQALVDCLRKIPPRLYSIASSLKEHPDEVHLTVVTVRYQAFGRGRKGVCSTYLADRVAEEATIPVYIDQNNNFKLPTDPAVPIIMVGPGTGIAPFRSFVEERGAIGATGKSWLFFGEQHFMSDFLYQAEWLKHLKQGTLSRMDVAFSRDQEQKIYVQHRMKERARDLYAWLQEGAHFYVCGDEKRMAHDVHESLIQAIEREGAMSREQAEDYVKTLQKEKRYQRDVY